MKKKYILKIMLLGLISLNLNAFAGEDKYSQLVTEISGAASSGGLTDKKIAIIPFSYSDAREGTTDGAIISERLIMKMINLQKFEIIERSVLDKVMNELKLQSSGIMDAGSTKELGKVLGVDAIITGTLVERKGGKIEVNARLIETETARAIGAAQVIIEKDWMGGDEATPQPVQEAVYKPKAKKTSTRTKGKHEYGYFDLFVGFGAPSINLEFANPLNNITLTANASDSTNDLGINFTGTPGDFKSIKWTELESEGVGPISMRVGGFGKGAIGGAMELSLEKRNIKVQDATWSLNDGPEANFSFGTEDYLTVTSFGISGDLYIRHAGKKIDPYIGMGLGLSLNSITLPYVKGFTNSSTFSKPVEQMGIGLMFKLPVGARIRIDEKTQIVTELRYEMNSIGFDRDIKSEEDRIVIHGVKFLIGMGFNF
ncbi:MAG: FlgO family outer membrane protein [Elusimicrobiota bacterium]|nr:FlgO family outer membrane protein [Elusimicrobiota bacterium]